MEFAQSGTPMFAPSDFSPLPSSFVNSDGLTARRRKFTSQIKFLNEAKHGITSCILIAPQLKKKVIDWLNLSVKERQRLANGRFQIFGEPKHRAIANYLIEGRTAASISILNPEGDTISLKDAHRLVFLLYPVLPDNGEKSPTMGFEVLYPSNSLAAGLVYTTQTNPEKPVVSKQSKN